MNRRKVFDVLALQLLRLTQVLSTRIVGQKPIRGFARLREYFEGKCGLEIGGPSALFRSRSLLPIYPIAGSCDNCNFASVTIWQEQGKDFRYSGHKPAGRQFICEATDLHDIGNSSYDFVMSSHVIEHSANPIKALKEWERVLRKNGVILVVCPDGRKTFDHRRPVTPTSHLVEDFDNNIDEHDLTHLSEIIDLHDLSLDIPAGTLEQFILRSQQNFENRCLHHHVFIPQSWADIFDYLKLQTLLIETAAPHHIVAIAKKIQ
jgi:SAM-dependent methyltransferase